jgi:glycosyltransferase involved in cell wall biosynthesis
MSELRVLNLFESLMPSGAEVMWKIAAEDFQREGIRHTLVEMGWEAGTFTQVLEESYSVVRYPLKPGPWGVRRLLRLFKTHRPDVVHCHSEAKSVAAALAAGMAGVAMCQTHHNIWATRSARHGLRRKLLGKFATRVAVGPSVLACERHWGPAELILNWASEPIGARRDRKTVSKPLRLVTVCNAWDFKRCDLMIEAVAGEDEVSLTHVGADPSGSFAEEHLRERGLTGRVRSVGPKTDVAPYLHEADAYICTSDHEGFGVAIYEALLSGLPLAIVDRPGVRDVLEYLPSAFLIDTGSKRPLAGLSQSIEQQLLFYERELDRIALKFGPTRGAKEYADLYRRLVAGRA